MDTLLTIIGWLLAVAVSVPLTVFALELLIGLWPGRSGARSAMAPRIAVLIPAHDEEGGIGAMLAELHRVGPPAMRVLVVADNCSDGTAAAARAAGAEVIERHDAVSRGKGFALAFGRDHLAAGAAPPDAVVVVDADCWLAPGSLDAVAAAALAADAPAQAVYLMEPDRADAAMVQISNFSMLVKNLYRSRGMQRMGGAALLTGTGMAFPWKLFAQAELATGSIVEDLKLGIEMTLAGHSPRLVSAAHARSRSARLSDTLTQRTRWEHGFLDTLRRHALPLLAEALKRGSRAQALLALHLLVPPLALLLMIAGAVLLVVVGLALLGGSATPAIVLGGLLALALALVLAAWLAGGRPYLGAGTLLRVPLYILWKVPMYARFLRRPETSWTRTPRRP